MARCSICKAELSENVRTAPFCSERCRLIDLGNWLGGSYRIAGEEPTDTPSDGDEEE